MAVDGVAAWFRRKSGGTWHLRVDPASPPRLAGCGRHIDVDEWEEAESRDVPRDERCPDCAAIHGRGGGGRFIRMSKDRPTRP
jgi:hypothetical protein